MGDVASVEVLLSTRDEFEQRIKAFFKEEIREANTLVAQDLYERQLSTLVLSTPSISSYLDSLQSSDELDAGTILQALTSQARQVLSQYLTLTRPGIPSREEAAVQAYFQGHLLDKELTAVFTTVEQLFEKASQRVKVMIGEGQNSEGRLERQVQE